jgi:hypothetical protein
MLTIPYHSRAIPTIKLGDSKFKYYPAAATDVQRTWARFGWKPIEVNKR